MTVRSVVVATAYWTAAILIACGVGIASGEPALRIPAPELAMGLTPFNGLSRVAAADQAMRAEVIEVGGDRWKPRYSATDLAAARAVLAMEPASAHAARRIGFQFVAQNQADRARRLIELSYKASRRDKIGLAWMIEDAARRGDITPLLTTIDVSLRVDPSSHEIYLPVIAQALAHPESVELGIEILGKNPPWLDEFMLEAVKLPAGLPYIAQIRSGLKRDLGQVMTDRDSALVGALQAARQFGTAVRFVEWRAPRPASERGNILRDGQFRGPFQFAPIDWQIVSEGDYGASVDPRSKRLVVSAIAGTGGSVARQIVELVPGRYQLVVNRSDAASEGGALSVDINCVAKSDGWINHLKVDRPRAVSTFTPPKGCRYFLVDLIAPVEAERGYDRTVDSILLTRVGG